MNKGDAVDTRDFPSVVEAVHRGLQEGLTEVRFYQVYGDEPMGSLRSPAERFCVHMNEVDANACAERLKKNGVENVSVVPMTAKRGPCE